MPEITHTFHSGVVCVAADRCSICHLAQIEGLTAVQRFENDRCSTLYGIVSKQTQLFDQVVACGHRMGHGRYLSVECRNHDYPCRAQLTCCSDDFAHRAVELLTYGFLFRKDEALESGTDCADLDVAPVQQLFQLLDSSGQVDATRFEANDSVGLHVVEFFGQRFTRSISLLEGEFQLRNGCCCFLFFAVVGATREQLHRSNRHGGTTQQRCF